MADFIADSTCLQSSPAADIAHIQRLARYLRIATPLQSELPWPPEKTRQELPAYGRSLLRMLQQCVNQNALLPRLEHTIPLAIDQLPQHRCWVPQFASMNVPWEAAHDDSGVPLFVDPRFSLLRFIRLVGDKSSEHQDPRPLSLMIAASMPRHAPAANVELQRQEITRALQSLNREGRSFISWFDGGTLASLRAQVSKEDINALHVIAHGSAGRILWQDHTQAPVWYSASEFADALRGLRLRFVLFSVCDSATADNEGNSLLTAVVDAGADAAVGMQGSIDDVAAAAFSAGFYMALGGVNYTSLDRLVAEGRGAILRTGTDGQQNTALQWMLPVLLVDSAPVYLRLIDKSVGTATSTGAARQGAHVPSPLRGDQVQPIAGTEAAEHPTARLLCDMPGCPFEEVRITQEGTTIGRSTACDIVLTGGLVSPFHATLLKLPAGQIQLRDNYSATGTYVNDRPITSSVLSSGDQIRIGEWILVFAVAQEVR